MRQREIWLRTEQHPVVKWLVNEGVRYRSFDEIYEQEADFSAVYRRIVDHLLAEAAAGKQVVYAVPGHPMVAERTVQLLLQEGKAQRISIDLRGGGSFLIPLLLVFRLIRLKDFNCWMEPLYRLHRSTHSSYNYWTSV